MRTGTHCFGKGFEFTLRDGESSFYLMYTVQQMQGQYTQCDVCSQSGRCLFGSGGEEGNSRNSEHVNPVLQKNQDMVTSR